MNLPFIIRAKNPEDAEKLLAMLREQFGYYDGEFESNGANVRGQCNEYSRDYLAGWARAMLEIAIEEKI